MTISFLSVDPVTSESLLRQYAFEGITTVTLVLTCFILYRAYTGPAAKLPGPWYTRFTGVWLLIQVISGRRSRYLHSLHIKHGGIVRVTPSEASIADLAISREIFKPSSNYLKSTFYTNFNIQSQDSAFTTLDPAVNARIRRVTGGPMTESAVKNLHPMIGEHAKLMVDQLLKEQSSQGYFDLRKWAALFAQDVVATASFGTSFHTLELGENTQYMKDITALATVASTIALLFNRPAASLPDLPIWPIRTAHRARKRTEAQAAELLEAYRNKQHSESEGSFTMLFHHLLGEKGRFYEFSEAELVLAAQGNLLAGTDTTGFQIMWLLYELVRHPDIMAKLRAEIALLPQEPTHEELKACTYLDYCLQEITRLRGSVMACLPRCVPPGGRNLGGFYLPEGFVVSPTIYVTNRNPSVFPEPELFKPERWENATRDMRDSVLTFGQGTRMCLGIHMARMTVRAAAFEMVRRLQDVELAIGADGFKDGDMEMVDYFVTPPRGGRCLLRAKSVA